MREIRLSGSEGGGAEMNRLFLPQSYFENSLEYFSPFSLALKSKLIEQKREITNHQVRNSCLVTCKIIEFWKGSGDVEY